MIFPDKPHAPRGRIKFYKTTRTTTGKGKNARTETTLTYRKEKNYTDTLQRRRQRVEDMLEQDRNFIAKLDRMKPYDPKQYEMQIAKAGTNRGVVNSIQTEQFRHKAQWEGRHATRVHHSKRVLREEGLIKEINKRMQETNPDRLYQAGQVIKKVASGLGGAVRRMGKAIKPLFAPNPHGFLATRQRANDQRLHYMLIRAPRRRRARVY